jgi:hypothetical protein
MAGRYGRDGYRRVARDAQPGYRKRLTLILAMYVY